LLMYVFSWVEVVGGCNNMKQVWFIFVQTRFESRF
jgi:hypothetical protein